MTCDLVVIGQVTRSHGVQGEVKARAFTESLDSFDRYGQVYLRLKGKSPRLHTVTESRPHKGVVLLKFREINTRNDAELLAGADVLICREWLPALDDDEYYWTDLIGLDVFNSEGQELGRVDNLFASGADDILLVKNGPREWLLPFRNEVVVSVEIAKGRLIVNPPEGLLDL